MHFSTAAAVTLLATTTSAWRAGFWSDGRSLQVHGTRWPVCNTIDPIRLGEVTFDTVTDNFPDPKRICLYSAAGCGGHIIFCGGKSLTGVRVNPSATAQSYKIGE